MGKRSKKIRHRKSKRSKRSVKKGGLFVEGKQPPLKGTCGGKRKGSSKKGGLFIDNKQPPLKGTCGGKRKRSSKNNGSNPDKMNDPNLSALCMKCFHSSGKKTKSRVMKLPGRNHTVNSRGRSMIRGACSKCSGKMVVFV